jgi:ribonucleoside-diphosphate reductase alpha chain
MAKSLMDYIFRWLGLRFLPKEDSYADDTFRSEPVITTMPAAPVTPATAPVGVAVGAYTNGHTNGNGHHQHVAGGIELMASVAKMQEDAPPCSECGMIMVRAGACYRCDNCGATSGCG